MMSRLNEATFACKSNNYRQQEMDELARLLDAMAAVKS